jgi:hypothetical protein
MYNMYWNFEKAARIGARVVVAASLGAGALVGWLIWG